MSFFYIVAGVNHFWHPAFYEKIMPPYLPAHLQLIYISGIAEILLGILLLFRQSRRLAAWGIIVLLIAIFPANIQMMLNYINDNNPQVWISIVRLPIQVVLIWWAWIFTK